MTTASSLESTERGARGTGPGTCWPPRNRYPTNPTELPHPAPNLPAAEQSPRPCALKVLPRDPVRTLHVTVQVERKGQRPNQGSP